MTMSLLRLRSSSRVCLALLAAVILIFAFKWNLSNSNVPNVKIKYQMSNLKIQVPIQNRTISSTKIQVRIQNQTVSNIKIQIPIQNQTTSSISTSKGTTISTATALPPIPQNFLRNNFSFIIKEEHFCSRLPHPVDSFNLVYIHSTPDQFLRREFIRMTWANKKFFKQTRIITIFMLGKSKETLINQFIQTESEEKHDIVQSDFIDAYKNLTFKAINSLRWIKLYCPKAKYILKSDDDIILNIFKLTTYLTPSLDKNILCIVKTNDPAIREKNSKWYIAYEEYPKKIYPDYCGGSAFFFTSETAIALYDVSKNVSYIRVDDVYVTGVLREVTDVKLKRFNEHYSFLGNCDNDKVAKDDKIIVIHSPFHEIHCMNLWLQILRNQNITLVN